MLNTHSLMKPSEQLRDQIDFFFSHIPVSEIHDTFCSSIPQACVSPNISLTLQTVEYFESRSPSPVISNNSYHIIIQ